VYGTQSIDSLAGRIELLLMTLHVAIHAGERATSSDPPHPAKASFSGARSDLA
jgi:hypothetical protein